MIKRVKRSSAGRISATLGSAEPQRGLAAVLVTQWPQLRKQSITQHVDRELLSRRAKLRAQQASRNKQTSESKFLVVQP